MDETTNEEQKLQLLEHMARELFIHKDVTPKQAFDMAQAFVDVQYDPDYRNIITMNQAIYVRYIVERHNSVYGNNRIELHIACTDIKDFKVINVKRYSGTNLGIPTHVESEARKQIDELLKKDGQRAGIINVREVNSFNGDF